MTSNALFEIDEFEGVRVGRDVRKMTAEQLEAAGVERKSRGDAIRARCLDCSHTTAEVKRCVSIGCALWPFRFGTDPFREKREMSDEQRAIASERLNRARLARQA